eukprot:scaffold60_cov137-Skeletonema_marinoi.AAC.20
MRRLQAGLLTNGTDDSLIWEALVHAQHRRRPAIEASAALDRGRSRDMIIDVEKIEASCVLSCRHHCCCRRIMNKQKRANMS